MPNQTEAAAHYYRQFRQRNPHMTALQAYSSAKSHVFFRARLSATIAESDRRSKAAKKAWKVRKAQAASQ